MAGQDPKKFKWIFRDKVNYSVIGEKIMRLAQEKLKSGFIKGDVWDYAKARGLDEVFMVEENGEVKFIDQNGNKIEKPKGYFFVGTSSEVAKGKRDAVLRMLLGERDA